MSLLLALLNTGQALAPAGIASEEALLSLTMSSSMSGVISAEESLSKGAFAPSLVPAGVSFGESLSSSSFGQSSTPGSIASEQTLSSSRVSISISGAASTEEAIYSLTTSMRVSGTVASEEAFASMSAFSTLAGAVGGEERVSPAACVLQSTLAGLSTGESLSPSGVGLTLSVSISSEERTSPLSMSASFSAIGIATQEASAALTSLLASTFVGVVSTETIAPVSASSSLSGVIGGDERLSAVTGALQVAIVGLSTTESFSSPSIGLTLSAPVSSEELISPSPASASFSMCGLPTQEAVAVPTSLLTSSFVGVSSNEALSPGNGTVELSGTVASSELLSLLSSGLSASLVGVSDGISSSLTSQLSSTLAGMSSEESVSTSFVSLAFQLSNAGILSAESAGYVALLYSARFPGICTDEGCSASGVYVTVAPYSIDARVDVSASQVVNFIRSAGVLSAVELSPVSSERSSSLPGIESSGVANAVVETVIASSGIFTEELSADHRFVAIHNFAGIGSKIYGSPDEAMSTSFLTVIITSAGVSSVTELPETLVYAPIGGIGIAPEGSLGTTKVTASFLPRLPNAARSTVIVYRSSVESLGPSTRRGRR